MRLSKNRLPLTICAAVLALAAPILTACTRPDPESSAPAIEFFTTSFDLGDIGWMSEQADEYGVDLNVSGLRAIDKDVAFLFGDVRVAAGTIRSILLRTTDGGESWHEAMQPVPGSELTHVSFSDPQHGWALAQWAVESAGTILLFGSTDGGTTWRQLTQPHLSKAHAVPDGTPLSMKFTGALNGELELAHDSESPSIDDTQAEIEVLASNDGGVTWSRVRRETRQWSPVEAQAKQSDRGFDNTDWEIDTRAAGEPISVRRFDREQNRWRVTTLPTHFRYQGGRVLASP